MAECSCASTAVDSASLQRRVFLSTLGLVPGVHFHTASGRNEPPKQQTPAQLRGEAATKRCRRHIPLLQQVKPAHEEALESGGPGDQPKFTQPDETHFIS